MNKFLIVVDMQNDFVDGALGTKEAVQIVDNVVNKIENFTGKIFVTYDTHCEDYLDTNEGKHLPIPHCIKETKGWMLNEKVIHALKGKTYTKILKTTFGSKELPDYFKDVKDDLSIELVGLCTDICVVSNALVLKANFPEADIRVDASCCAGVSPQTHNAALEVMRCCQIDVIE